MSRADGSYAEINGCEWTAGPPKRLEGEPYRRPWNKVDAFGWEEIGWVVDDARVDMICLNISA